MQRSWLIHALIASSVGSAVLLLFSVLNDAWNLASHSYLVPVPFTGTLWNVVGLLPSPASLVGLIPHVTSDPILTPHYRSPVFFSVLIITALLCLAEAYGLRSRQHWALLAMALFIAVDFLVQASDFSSAIRLQWPVIKEAQGFLAGFVVFSLATKRMFLKLCLDTGCAAFLLSGGYGDVSLFGARAQHANAPRPLPSFPPAMPHQDAANAPSVYMPPVERTPLLRSTRTVFLAACACAATLVLLILSNWLAPATPPGQYDIHARLTPAFLFALLHYGLAAWHTRRAPERFGLGLAFACSLTVSAAGFASGPVLLLALLQRPGQVDPSSSGLMPLAFLTLIFLSINFVLLLGSLRTSWLARSEESSSPMSWTLGFAFPFVMLIVVRGIVLR
jgi:hypothetical protein